MQGLFLLAALFLFAFTLVLAALLAFGFAALLGFGFAALLAFSFAAFLAGLGLAALVGATLGAVGALVLGADAVAGALALVLAALMLMLAALGVGGIGSLLGGFVVAAGAHAQGESGGNESG